MTEFVDLLTLQSVLREELEEVFPDGVWVKAEIASVQVKSGGHCYLDLCQSTGRSLVAKARGIIWRNAYGILSRCFREATGSNLESGMTILVHAKVNYSELYGLSLVIDDLDAAVTVGEAELLRRRTLERLQKEGLLDLQKELSLPQIPRRLAVISAPTAAGYGDFCRHLEENEYGFAFDVTLFEATMQGEKAPGSIREALEAVQAVSAGRAETAQPGRAEADNAAAQPGWDAVLILRGGGSALDLACFDDYGLCEAIAKCSIPVITAIGHERDTHIADLVACDCVKTPTALADLFIDALAAEDERISSLQSRLRMAFVARLSAMESAVTVLENRIKSADPRNILARGYTLVTDSEGVVVKSARKVSPGDTLRIYFADGAIRTIVQPDPEAKPTEK